MFAAESLRWREKNHDIRVIGMLWEFKGNTRKERKGKREKEGEKERQSERERQAERKRGEEYGEKRGKFPITNNNCSI